MKGPNLLRGPKILQALPTPNEILVGTALCLKGICLCQKLVKVRSLDYEEH